MYEYEVVELLFYHVYYLSSIYVLVDNYLAQEIMDHNNNVFATMWTKKKYIHIYAL